MRKELLNFLGLSQRSYYTWQKDKHPHIIEIVNDVFKTKEDILFFNLFWELPYSYSNSHKKTYNEKSYKEKLCEILGIKQSSYYHWQTGKRENIIKLFETIFKNIDDLDYWIQNKKFQTENQTFINHNLYDFINDLCENQKFFDEKNNPLDIGNLSSGLNLSNLNIKDPIIYFLINLKIEKIDKNNIKYSIINKLKIDDYIPIDSYIKFLKKIDSTNMEKIFSKSFNLDIYFFDCIKRLDIDMFIKLIFLSYHTKRIHIHFDLKPLLIHLDNLFDVIKYHTQIKIKYGKNIQLRNEKMKLMMAFYRRWEEPGLLYRFINRGIL